MYLRIKRKKMVVFLQVGPVDSVGNVKEALHEYIQEVRGPGPADDRHEKLGGLIRRQGTQLIP